MNTILRICAASIVLLVYSCSNLLAQLSNFQGVFVSQENSLVLALRLKNNTLSAYITDGNVLEQVTCTWQDPTLKMAYANNPSAGASFGALDEAGNLWVTDEQLNIVYFTRSSESIDAVWKELESAYNVSTQTTTTPSAAKASNTGSYANKKFLHLYTGNGYTEKWAYYLYENGTFYFRSSSAYSSGGYYDFSAATSGDDGGKYAIEKKSGQEYLTLFWNNGEQTSLRISKTDQGYLLNNEKYFLVGLNEYD
ncbi:MAG: hypothetical protein ACK478_07855 [Flavobacteriales bacterium]|jgi:hypothetical protein